MARTEFPNIDFRFRRGNAAGLKHTAIKEKTFNITKDTEELFIDIDGKRIKISDFVPLTEDIIRAIEVPLPNKLYIAIDTHRLLYFDAEKLEWMVVGSNDVDHAKDADNAIHDQKGNVIDEHYISSNESYRITDELQAQINGVLNSVAEVSRFKQEVVDNITDLPLYGEGGTIYFVRESDEVIDETGTMKTVSIHGEYIWMEKITVIPPEEEGGIATQKKTGYYEKIGITTMDLGNYYKKPETDDLLQLIGLKKLWKLIQMGRLMMHPHKLEKNWRLH